MTDFEKHRTNIYGLTPSWPGHEAVPGSDIVLHLPVLEYYASLCNSVTEFGVRDCHSTVALIAGCKGEISSFDVARSDAVDVLQGMRLPCSQWMFARVDTVDPDQAHHIKSTDLILFDTLHTFTHLDKELRLHGRKAQKYIVFHDTHTCGEFDRTGPNPAEHGILPAIEAFLHRYEDDYQTVYRTDACNGLWILERLA